MFDLLGSGALSILAFVSVMSFVVVMHELGHYGAGRYFGVHAEAFSIGFGPTLFSWRDGAGTVWRVAALPLGGYVRFRGDENAASAPDRAQLELLRSQRSDADTVLHFKPVWQRAIIVAAGPIANFVLAIAVFSLVGFVRGDSQAEVYLTEVLDETPAQRAGFQPGDVLVAFDGQAIRLASDVPQHIAVRAGQPVRAEILRDGNALSLMVTPERQLRDDGLGGQRALGTLGVRLASRDGERICCNLLQAPVYGVMTTWETTATIGDYLLRLVTGRASFEMVNGPLGIATTAGQVANAAAAGPVQGTGDGATAPSGVSSMLEAAGRVVLTLLTLSALLSVALGLMNLLPIPVLDGGHLVYYAYEAITHKPPSPAVQEVAFRTGFLLLIGVMVVATWNDLSYLRGLFS